MKASWVELDRVVSEEILRDDDIRRRVAESGRPLRSHATGMSDDDLLAMRETVELIRQRHSAC